MDLLTRDSKETEAKRAIEKQMDALRHVWSDFPEFPKLMMRVDTALVNYAKEKNIGLERLKVGDMRWHNEGTVTAELFLLNVEAVGVKDKHEQLAKVMFALGHQLVAIAERRKSTSKLYQFSGVRIQNEMLIFRIRKDNKPMGPKDIHL